LSIFKEKELLELLSYTFKVGYGDISKEVFFNNGLLNRISGGDIYLYNVNSKKVICKIITNNVYEKIGEQLDPDGKEGLLDLWIKSQHRIKNSFMLEDKVYTKIDSLFYENIPDYYGSFSDKNRGVIFIEYIEDSNETINMNDEKIKFLSFLHNHYFEKESLCRSIGVYTPTIDVYKHSSETYLRLLHCIGKYFPMFPKTVLNDLKYFINNIDDQYRQMVNYGRSLCHGDYSHGNIKISNGKLKVFDWEGACFFNPEFDLLRFVSDISVDVTDDYLIYVMREYYKNAPYRKEKKEFQNCLILNSQLQFLDSLSWILLLRRFDNKDNILPKSCQIYLHIYYFLRKYNFNDII